MAFDYANSSISDVSLVLIFFSTGLIVAWPLTFLVFGYYDIFTLEDMRFEGYNDFFQKVREMPSNEVIASIVLGLFIMDIGFVSYYYSTSPHGIINA